MHMMITSAALHVAVVGLGFGAEFVPIYLDHPDVATVAICDQDAARLRMTGDRFGIERRFRDPREVIASPDVDAVHLVSGIPDHAAHAVAAFESGKHCACTVPMATSLQDLRAIVDAQRKSRLSYMMMETAVCTRPFPFRMSRWSRTRSAG
jgi:predicted dehydrogenase